MKQLLRVSMFGVVASILSVLPANADTPTVTINSPTGTVYVGSFPYSTSLNITLGHSPLSDLHVLNVFVDGVSLFGADVGNPFDSSNNCKNPNLTSVTTSCSTNGLDSATIVVPWTVNAPGSFTVTVSVKHQGLTGEDEETVTFSLIAVEYPAPPAIANAYINKQYGAKTGAQIRGCIISQVADRHAKDSYYGPKGGPYDNVLVKADVDAFWAACSAQ